MPTKKKKNLYTFKRDIPYILFGCSASLEKEAPNLYCFSFFTFFDIGEGKTSEKYRTKMGFDLTLRIKLVLLLKQLRLSASN